MPSEQSRYAVVAQQAAQRGGPPTSDPAAADAERLPDSARTTIGFAFAVLSGWGMVRNPFLAVWIENEKGELVRSVFVRELEGINTLPDWYAAWGGGEDAAATGGTKGAGSHQVIWDGKDDAGNRVPAGDYYVCVEASRELGPCELMRERMAFGSTPFSRYLPASGELTHGIVKYAF